MLRRWKHDGKNWKENKKRSIKYVISTMLCPLFKADGPSKRFSPSFLLMRLRHATTAQDDLSESVASTFVKSSPPEGNANGGRDVDEFVKQFRDLRKTYHKRVIWGSGANKIDWRD